MVDCSGLTRFCQRLQGGEDIATLDTNKLDPQQEVSQKAELRALPITMSHKVGPIWICLPFNLDTQTFNTSLAHNLVTRHKIADTHVNHFLSAVEQLDSN